MGQFADANLPAMSEAELDAFERLLDAPDPEVLAWITGEEPSAARVRHAPSRAPQGGAARRPDERPTRRPVTNLASAARRLAEGGAVTLARAPEGYDAFVVAELTRALAKAGEARAVTLVFVARDSVRAQSFIDALSFAAPEIEALYLPSWDCQPYDRVSPNAAVSRRADDGARAPRPHARRASSGRASSSARSARSRQRVPPLNYVASAAFSAAPGNSVRMDELALWLETNGYSRASTVREVGDYASRGGILDLYPPGAPAPIRLDFFGDTLELIRTLRSRDAAQRRAVALARPRADERGAAHDRDDPPLPPGLRRRVRRSDPGRRALCRRQRGPPRHRPRALAAASLRAARHAVRLCRRRALRARRAGRGGRAPAHRARSPTPTPRGARPTHRIRSGPTTSRLPPARLYLTEDEWKGRLAAAAARAPHPLRGCSRRGRRRRLRRTGRAQFRPRAAERERQRVRRRRRAHPGSARTRPDRDRRRLERRLAREAEPRARRARAQIARARLLVPSGKDGARGRAAARGHRARAGLRGARSRHRRRAGHSR